MFQEKFNFLLIFLRRSVQHHLEMVTCPEQSLERISDVIYCVSSHVDIHCQSLHLFVQVDVSLFSLSCSNSQFGPKSRPDIVHFVFSQVMHRLVSDIVFHLDNFLALKHGIFGFLVLVFVTFRNEVHHELIASQNAVS